MARVDLLRPGTRVPESGGAELSEVISEFNDMVSRLEDERRASSRATLQEQEDERRRIGRELHDEIGQRMTAILLQLRRARRDAPADILPHLDEAQSEARAALDEVGRLAARLRPGILDDLGLPSALEDLVASCARHSDVAIDAEVDRGVEVTADEELALYRIAQEALTNALRHSGATSVRLELRDDPDTVCLRVSDDGNGLAGAERYDSGIRGMRVRALQIGADLDIRSGPGLGVVVAVRLAKGLR
jgi:two-component system sensor histidine kinase UhpB